MKLDFETIKKITFGYVSFSQKEDKLAFYRLTEAQKAAFVREQESHIKKVNATCGIRFDFITDSKTFKMAFSDVGSGSSRTFYSFDVYENGEMIYSYFGDYEKVSADEFSVSLSGNSRVQVFFPNLSSFSVVSVELDDGATVTPVVPKCNILMHGDSITHGYDAIYSSQSYANRVARKLDAQIVNTAIGGAVFNPEVIEKPEGFEPDLITVAYGTNDWSKLEKAKFQNNFITFIEKLNETYPGVPKYYILPIWRGDNGRVTDCGTFDDHREYMKKEIEKRGCIALESMDFVPHDAHMFSPDLLHPNDNGFFHYANNLIKHIK
ncbi:MAG: hypothetical protein IJ408_04000 [Clostridia bacterium]|nr:hypothetical protein [Clostridia bacterium]